jgi:AAA family ATP:ADP antiporter
MIKEFFSNRRFFTLFSLMFSVVCLLNINYCLLRSARNALAVADLGGGAQVIPIYDLCGTIPGAVLMVFLLTRLLNRFSIQRVFLITLSVFLGFFLLFAFLVYPSLHLWKEIILGWTWLWGHEWLAVLLPQGASMIFFVMAELWKIALLTVLFWGLVNQYTALLDAKKLYAPLMLGTSIGTMLSGPIVRFCTSDALSHGLWSRSLMLIVLSICLIGALVAWFYTLLWMQFSKKAPLLKERPADQPPLSLRDSVRACVQSKYLSLLGWLTIAEYVAYTLGEVVFLDVLKQKYPDPRQYCEYNGQLSFWYGLLTALSALIITPILVKRCRWVVASLVMPVCLLVTEGAFFFTLWTPSKEMPLDLLVLLGTIFFCSVRAAKYTMFDTSKELSFLLLPPLEKMQGKLIIDGICSRIGRGGASLLSIGLIQLFGGIMASVFVTGCIAVGVSASCVVSTVKLGFLVDKRSQKSSNPSS